jgi:hypothetical protein
MRESRLMGAAPTVAFRDFEFRILKFFLRILYAFFGSV